MARSTSVQDPALLEAALEGLEHQKQRIEDQINQVRALLGRSSGRRGRPFKVAPAAKESTAKRVLSSSARKRIAAAQKKRWADFRKRNAEQAG